MSERVRRPTIIVVLALALCGSASRADTHALYQYSFGSIGSGPGQFGGPDGIAASDDRFLYVADTYNSRVQKFTLTGEYVSSFGTPGTGPGQFLRPYGIDVDAAGNVYVGDLDRHDVQKFAADGTWLLAFGSAELSEPFGLWADDAGVVYVTDRPAGCIRKYGSGGAFLGNIGPDLGGATLVAPQNVGGDGQGELTISDGSGAFRIVVVNSAGTLVRAIASPPNGPSTGNPTGGDFAAGLFFLTQYNLNRAVVLDADAVVDILGDNEPVTFATPLDCATSGDSLLFVLDTGNCRVHRFHVGDFAGAPTVHVVAPNGGENLVIGSAASLQWTASDDGAIVSYDVLLSRDFGATLEPIATGLTSTSYAWTVSGPASPSCLLTVRAHDNDGLTGEDRSDGVFSIGSGAPPLSALFLDAFGTQGSGPGQFGGPDGIAVSDDHFIYVADTYNSRVQKFTLTGGFVTSFGSFGSGPGQFSRPYGIDVDADGNVYVGDLDRRDVQKFSPGGGYLATIGAGSISQPFGLWVGDDGIVYVTDRPTHRIDRFRTDGTPLASWGPVIGGVSLVSPQNIEGDGKGDLYVSDGAGSFHVHVISTAGTFIRTVSIAPEGNPTGAAVALGTLFQSQYDIDRVLGVDLSSDAILFSLTQANGIPLDSPIDCATSGDSLLLVLDTGVCRVLRYRLLPGEAPHATVVGPNGDEVLTIGETTALRWTATDDQAVASVDLLLSRDGGQTYDAIATGLANSGSYDWIVTGPTSSSCRLKVVARDAEGREGADDSDANWSIVPVQGHSELTFLDTFGTDELGGPDGITTSGDGFVFVADTYHSRVVKFTADGQLVSTFGSPGAGPGQFGTPYGIGVDLAGNIYVSDFTRRDLQKFDPEGHYVATLAGPDVLQEPLGLWVSDEGVVYLTDREAHVIRRYTSDGTPLAPWGPGLGSVNLIAPQNIEGTNGDHGQRAFYVSDGSGADRIHVLDKDGNLTSTFNSIQGGNPTGAALLGSRLLLTEYNLDLAFVVVVPGGLSLETLGDDDPYTLSSPLDAATLGDSMAYVLDTGHHRVVRFRWDGSPPPQALVTGPNGGESIAIGTTAPLRWLAGDDQSVTSVDLWVSHDEGETYAPVALGVENTGQYDWVASGPPSSECRFRVVAHDALDLTGADRSDAPFSIVDGGLAVGDAAVRLALSASPNPMHAGCRVTFALPRAGEVRLVVHDLQGREIARLADGRFGAGRHELTWRGETSSGPAASGLYFMRLVVAGDRTLVRRLVLTR